MHIRNKGEVGAINHVKPSSRFFYWPLLGGTSFVDPYCYLCFMYVMLSCLFLAALRPPSGEGVSPFAVLCVMFIVFCRFPIWYPTCTGVVHVFDS